jgi:hypothetical protein
MHINIILVVCLIWFDATTGLHELTMPRQVDDFNLNKVSRQDEVDFNYILEQSFPPRQVGTYIIHNKQQ